MNQRFVSVLLFAFVVAGGASLMLYRLMSSRVTANAKPAAAQVILAARTLELGTLIRDSDLKVGDWNGSLPKGAATKKDDVIGRGVVATVYEGEPILETRLATKGAGAGLAATIPAGMRAVAVHVNEVVGVAGFVVPGMRVDVLISGTPPGQNTATQGTLTRTLLQNIEVLSAGQNIQKDAEGKPVTVPVVNLLVTPEQAEILSLASNETRIQLVLRNPLDTVVAKTPGTALARLFLGQALPPEPRSQPRPRVVKQVVLPPPEKPAPPVVMEILNGSKRTDAKFQSTGEAR